MAANLFTDTGDHNWNTAGNWSDGVPTSDDTCTVAAGTTSLIINATASCSSLDLTGTAGVTISGSFDLSVAGNFILDANVAWSHTGKLKKNNTGTFTTAARDLSSVNEFWSLVGATTLNGLLNVGSKPCYVLSGSLATGNNNITCSIFGDRANGAAVTLTLGSSTINCSNVSFAAATLTVTANTAQINMSPTANVATNFNGKNWNGTSVTINASASTKVITLGDSPTLKDFVMQTGTFDRNSKTLTVNTFNSSNISTRIFQNTGGAGKVVVTGLTGTVINFATTTNLTLTDPIAFDIGSSNLTLTGDVTFAGGGKTFGALGVKKHAGNFATIISGDGTTFGAIAIEVQDATYQYNDVTWQAGSTFNMASCVAGNSSYPLDFKSSSAGTAAILVDSNGGTNAFTNVDIQDMEVSGAVWLALLGDGNSDVSGNSGWTWMAGYTQRQQRGLLMGVY